MSLLGRAARFVLTGAAKLTTLGCDKGPHIWRYSMYREVGKIRTQIAKDARVLSISGSNRLCHELGVEDSRIVEADYPEHNLMALNFPDSSFDVVVSDQVLEHLEGDPQRAFRETLRVLRPGGIAVHTTVFMHHIHWGPKDFWRFSPDALRFLASEFREVLLCGGWGNPLLPIYFLLGLRFIKIPHAHWHPLHRFATWNHPVWPHVTWVVARK